MSRPHAISINTLCLPPGSLAIHAEMVARLGAAAISPDIQDFEGLTKQQATRILRDADLDAAIVTHRAFAFVTPESAAEQRHRLNKTIEIAHTIGAAAVCLTTGGRGNLSWTEATTRFAEEIAPCVEEARQAGVTLGIEPTSHLYADASIVHRLTDVVSLARAAKIGVGIDFFPCWVDSDIEDAIAAASPLYAFVQVSDYVLGDRGLPCRAVPGDGAIPIGKFVGLLAQNGYSGPFDIEIIGPRLAEEGYDTGLRRAMSYLAVLINQAYGASQAAVTRFRHP